MDAFLASLGIKKAALVAGFVGGLISLRFFDGLTSSQKFATAVSGAASANYLTDPTIAHFALTVGYEGGIGFAIGLFGMSVAAALVRLVKDTDWAGVLKGRFGGREG